MDTLVKEKPLPPPSEDISAALPDVLIEGFMGLRQNDNG